MVKHIILWQLKSELSDEEKAAVKAGIKTGLESLLGVIPGLTAIDFTDCTNLESISGLTNPNLNEITISGCTALKKVVFDDPNGWSVTSADLAQPILPELSDSAANVTLLTTDYAEGTWVKES